MGWIIFLLVAAWSIIGASIGGAYAEAQPENDKRPNPELHKIVLVIFLLGPIAWVFGIIGGAAALIGGADGVIDKYLYPKQEKK